MPQRRNRDRQRLLEYLDTYDFVHRMESKEAYQCLVLSELSISTLFPQQTPKQRPTFIKPSWWQGFEKARDLQKAGYSMKDVQSLKACHSTREWLKNAVQNAHMLDLLMDEPLSEEDELEISKRVQGWVNDALSGWNFPLWLKLPEKNMFQTLDALNDRLIAEGKEHITPAELFEYAPQVYLTLYNRNDFARVNLESHNYSSEQMVWIMENIHHYSRQIKLDWYRLPAPNDIYRIGASAPADYVCKQLWHNRVARLLMTVRQYGMDDLPDHIQRELERALQQLANCSLCPPEFISRLNKIDPDGHWDHKQLKDLGISLPQMPASNYHIKHAPRGHQEALLFDFRFRKLLSLHKENPELLREHHRTELRLAISIASKFGDDMKAACLLLTRFQSDKVWTPEDIQELYDQLHPKKIAAYRIGLNPPETDEERKRFDTRLKKLLHVAHKFNDELSQVKQQEIQQAAEHISKPGLNPGKIVAYFNKLDPAGDWQAATQAVKTFRTRLMIHPPVAIYSDWKPETTTDESVNTVEPMMH